MSPEKIHIVVDFLPQSKVKGDCLYSSTFLLIFIAVELAYVHVALSGAAPPHS